MEAEKEEQRDVVCFLTAEQVPVNEIHAIMKIAYRVRVFRIPETPEDVSMGKILFIHHTVQISSQVISIFLEP